MKSMSESCSNAFGSIINWSDLMDRTSGMVINERPSSCKPLRNNKEYDVIADRITPLTKSHHFVPIKISDTFPSLNAVTVAMWEKCKCAGYRKYVHFRSTNGTTLLAFGLWNDVLVFVVAGAARRQARVPMFWKESPAYWHHIATTWSSLTGKWKIYLDGSLVSVMHEVASGIAIPTGNELSLHMIKYAKNCSVSRVNIWDYEVDGLAISLMANKGPLFENGNVFAWYGVKLKTDANVSFRETPRDLYNSRTSSLYQMNFPEASIPTYARLNNAFTLTIQSFSACFWAKILRTNQCAIFSYSTPERDHEIAVYINEYHELHLAIKGEDLDSDHKISTPESWHFYCVQWQSKDGLMKTYQDALLLDNKENLETNQTVAGGGNVVLGHVLGFEENRSVSNHAFAGRLAGLNFWSYFLTANEIQGMAAGVTNVNGNLLQWKIFKDHIVGAVSIDDRSEAEIPEYRAQHMRDKWCEEECGRNKCCYARYIRSQNDGYRWRCVMPSAMLVENMCYSISRASKKYRTREEKLLGVE